MKAIFKIGDGNLSRKLMITKWRTKLLRTKSANARFGAKSCGVFKGKRSISKKCIANNDIMTILIVFVMCGKRRSITKAMFRNYAIITVYVSSM